MDSEPPAHRQAGGKKLLHLGDAADITAEIFEEFNLDQDGLILLVCA
jgi:hypothetical protein